MKDVDEQVRQLQNRIEQARREKMRAEMLRDEAQANVNRLREQLKTEFGVSDVARAREKLTALHSDLDTALTEATKLLERLNK